jgi:hypothetical protein
LCFSAHDSFARKWLQKEMRRNLGWPGVNFMKKVSLVIYRVKINQGQI